MLPTEKALLAFLTEMFEAVHSYSAINSARSAVSALAMDSNPPLGQATLICKFLRGVFNIRPQLPRYSRTWDANIVLIISRDYLLQNLFR